MLTYPLLSSVSSLYEIQITVGQIISYIKMSLRPIIAAMNM